MTRREKPSFWTEHPEAVNRLLVMREKGKLSSRYMAAKLGTTRNAVIGKLTRLGLPSIFKGKHTKPAKPLHKPSLAPLGSAAPTVRRGTGYNFKSNLRLVQPPSFPESAPQAIPGVPSVPLGVRTGCAWVVTELPSPLGQEALYCNSPLDLPKTAQWGAYCEHHRQRLKND